MTTFNENLEEDCQFDPNKLDDLGGDLNEVRLFGSIDLVHQKPNLNKGSQTAKIEAVGLGNTANPKLALAT